MKEEYYLIKEAAAKIGVESHVLRYWEEELKMEIHRNEMGHRYYTERDIEIFTRVRDLKEKGLQLKAIRNYLDKRREQITKGDPADQTDVIQVVSEESSGGNLEKEEPPKEEPQKEKASKQIVPVKQSVLSNEEKLEQFQQIMSRILSNAIKENNELIGKSAGEHAASAVVTRIQGMTKEQEERAEARYQKLDQTLREIQRARMEAAAANMRPVDKRKQKRMKRKNGQAPSPTQETENDKNSEKV